MPHGRIPPLLSFVNRLTSDSSRSWTPKNGWQMDVAFGVTIGALGMYIFTAGASGTEKLIAVALGGALGGASGYGLACALSSTELIVLGVLVGGLVAVYFAFEATAGAAAAAAPGIVSSLPLLLA